MIAFPRTARFSRLALRLAPLLLLAALLPADPGSFGQPQTARAAASTNLPFKPPIYLGPFRNNNSGPTATALGDLNGDGTLDIVLGNNSAPSQIYLNGGHGNFTPTAEPLNPNGSSTTSVAVGDLNGDGALDIILGNNNAPSQIYLNDGKGNFRLTAAPLDPGGSDTRSVAVGDLNGDGALDIVLGNFGPSQIYLNDGRGNFSPTATPINPDGNDTSSVVVGDLNGDGALDIVLGNGGFSSNSSQQSQVYLNDGNANFSPTATALNPNGNASSGLALGDLNGDGALDIVLGNGNGVQFPRSSQVYLNDGKGNFSPTAAPLDPDGSDSFSVSVAVGDLNGDGALDIVLGNSAVPTTGPGNAFLPSQVYLNDGKGNFSPTAAPLDSGGSDTRSVAVGDLNGDGALDIVLGNFGPSQIYLNDGNYGFSSTAVAEPVSLDGYTPSMTMGDLNGDGALDIVLGNPGLSHVYLNDGKGNFSLTAAPLNPGGSDTNSVAVGDLNGDGALDIVLGNGNPFASQPSQVYLNDGHGNFTLAAPLNPNGNATNSVALGDLNGDGALDIILSNVFQPSQVYLNDGHGNFNPTAAPLNPGGSPTGSVAVGDLNGDGALDIILGNNGASQVYLNDGKGNFSPAAAPLNPVGSGTNSVAVGDLNGDGALDIVLGNIGASQVYLNDGKGNFSPAAAPLDPVGNDTSSVAVGDLNGDRAPDIVLGNKGASQVYLNDGKGNFTPAATPLNPGGIETISVAVGDLNGDGALDIVLGNFGGPINGFEPSRVYLNGTGFRKGLPNNPPTLRVRQPGPTAAANFYATPAILSSQVISIPYDLSDLESDPVREVRAEYSLDGGGQWKPAIAASGTITTNLSTSPNGDAHTFAWDTAASGFFGQSDRVVVRIIALPGVRPAQNGIAGPYQRPLASATTFPFRARGIQVRVVDAQGTPKPGAVVFRLRDGLPPEQQLIAPDSQSPGYTTDANGYLSGRGQVALGDQLIALAPVVPLPGPYADVYSHTVRLFDTNIITTSTGVAGATIAASGVQTVTVSPNRPLALFDLAVSLEWDARNDQRFMTQLTSDLRRASELLFQATHGQAALGVITLFYDKENWDNADIRIYASNRIRPSALIGGVSTAPINDPDAPDRVAYGPGQVKIGAVWNRFGTPSGNLSEDWPRTLVHELGHYLFFLEDNYLGLNSGGRIAPVSTCQGLMSDPYTNIWQFQTAGSWGTGCANTFSNQATGRDDWRTIATFYPGLRALTTPIGQLPPGPASMPIPLTEIGSVDPLTPTAHLDVPIFYTVDAATGGRLLPGATARAYLFHAKDGGPAGSYDRLTSLGRSNLDQVLARGARVGDRLCLFDPASSRYGCQTIQAGVEKLPIAEQIDWKPDVQVTPVTSRTLDVVVSGVPDGAPGLRADVYPLDGDPLPAPATLTPVGAGVYSGRVTLINPLDGANVHIATNELSPRWETITSFALGGNAGGYTRVGGGYTRVGGGYTRVGGGYTRVGGGYTRVGGGYTRVGGGYTRVGGGYTRVGGGFTRVGGAPVASSEGDVLVVSDSLNFAVGQFLMLQTVSTLPPPPSWATLVGSGYRFTTSTGWLTATQALATAQLSFNYLDSDVPAGEENNIQVYYRAPDATSWQAVETQRDTTYNIAAIPWQGPGTYALMTSVVIKLPVQGWNNIAYPVPGSRPVGQALASIDGQYNLVFGYEPSDQRDPWKVYTPAPVPGWVNDLTELTFGRGYWIHTTQPTNLLLNGNGLLAAQAARLTDAAISAPPAVIYGAVPVGNRSAPAAGQPVEARIEGAVCGRGTTRLIDGQIVFVVKVAALEPSNTTCGAPGRVVEIRVAGQAIGRVAWDNTRVLDIANTRVYLPLVRR